MPRFQASTHGRLVLVMMVAAAAEVCSMMPAHGAGPSVCLVPEPQCHVVDGQVDVTLQLGASPVKIAAGQFSFTYDPASLEFAGIASGQSCDPSSPFTQILFQDVDPLNGTIFFVSSVPTFSVSQATQGPATLACLTFIARSTLQQDLCLNHGIAPLNTILSDNAGNAVPIDNTADCPAAQPATNLSCMTAAIGATCACTGGVPNCQNLDSDCSVGVCNNATGRCEKIAIHEGEPCDDGSSCTQKDTCDNGTCVGVDCSLPSVCIVSNFGASEASGTVNLRVEAGPTNARLAGAQFLVQYDPATLRFVNITPGAVCDPFTPFDQAVFQSVDETAGEIFYSVTLDPANIDMETFGPATLACLTFRILQTPRSKVCLVSRNPLRTILSDEFGASVPISVAEDCPSSLPPPILTCDRVTKIIPATSDWGIVILALTLAVAGKITFSPRRS